VKFNFISWISLVVISSYSISFFLDLSFFLGFSVFSGSLGSGSSDFS